MLVSTYLILVASIALITDLSGYQDSLPPFVNLCRKHPVLSHLLRCSLCATFWFTVISILFFSIPVNALFLPFVSRLFTSTVSSILNLLYWMVSFLDRL